MKLQDSMAFNWKHPNFIFNLMQISFITDMETDHGTDSQGEHLCELG